MRMTVLSGAAVFLLSIGLCVAAMCYVGAAADELDGYCVTAPQSLEEYGREAMRAELERVIGRWRAREDWLALLVSHAELNEVNRLLSEMKVTLEAGETDDFLRAATALLGLSEHLREEQQFRIVNVF